jgi:hypothetical protein
MAGSLVQFWEAFPVACWSAKLPTAFEESPRSHDLQAYLNFEVPNLLYPFFVWNQMLFCVNFGWHLIFIPYTIFQIVAHLSLGARTLLRWKEFYGQERQFHDLWACLSSFHFGLIRRFRQKPNQTTSRNQLRLPMTVTDAFESKLQQQLVRVMAPKRTKCR